MANINLNIPDAQLQRVIEALCASRMIDAAPIPPTPANAKAIVITWIKECVFKHEKTLAEQAIVVDVSTLAT